MREMTNRNIGYINASPVDWPLVPGKSMFSEVKDKNNDGSEATALKFTYGEIVRKENFDASAEEYVAETIKAYNRVKPGDVVVNGLNLNYDFVSQRVAIVREKGVITSAYVVLRPKEHINPKFINYLLKSCDNMKVFHGMGEGVRQTIKFDDLGDMTLVCPARDEQNAIVTYLDAKCAAIDKAIERHKKIIEMLTEFRIVTIAQCVQGSHAENRVETDFPWIPHLPESIKLSRIGMHFDVVLGKMLCPKQRDGDDTLEQYFCAADVHFDEINYNNLKKMWYSPCEKSIYRVENGDLLVVEGGAGAGGSYIVHGLKNPTYIQNSILRIRGSATGSVRFLKYYLEYLVKRDYIPYACNTATFSHFTKDKVRNTPFPAFSFVEQEAIADRLDRIDANTTISISKHANIIEKLEEYRKSIIYNAVTGKIDCRKETGLDD